MTVRTRLTFVLLLSAVLTRPETAVRTAAAHTETKAAAASTPAVVPSESRILEALSRIRFEPNRGQLAERAEFIGRGAGVTVLFGTADASIRLRDESVQLAWQRPSPQAFIAGEKRLPGTVSYLQGQDERRWVTGLPTYGQVRQQRVYPGIDIVYYGHTDGLEFDLAVAPHADLAQAELAITGARSMRINAAGVLELTLTDRVLEMRAPVAFQDGPDGRRPIPVHYVQRGANTVGFRAESYDRSRALIVDPVIAYSTLKGGVNEDRLWATSVDPAGNIYAAISTNPYTTTSQAPFDVYIVKFDPTLSTAMYTMLYGGATPSTCRDRISTIQADAGGHVYVYGQTNCTDYPVSGGALSTPSGGLDTYVTKVNPTGTGWTYSARFGSTANDFPQDMFVDAAGNAYLTGRTSGANYPLSPGAYRTAFAVFEAYVSKLNPAGSALVYSTFIGGNALDQGAAIEVDALGNAHVLLRTDSTDMPTTGGAFQPVHGGGVTDGYVAGLNSTGTGITYATHVGGNGIDFMTSLALNGAEVVVAGGTTSTNYPVAGGAFQGAYGGGSEDAVITKINMSGGLVYSTYLGGALQERANAVAVDNASNVYATGPTASINLPTLNAIQPTAPGGGGDGWVARLNASNAMGYVTYLGGSLGQEEPTTINVDGMRVVIGGSTSICNSCTVNDYPVTPGAHQTVSGGGLAQPMVRFDGYVTVLLARSLTLTPATQTLTVPGPHTVTATLTQDGTPLVSHIIKFTVTGGTTTNGSCTTNGVGQCTFSYSGALLSGTDTINAYGDADNDTFADFDEPLASATASRSYPGGGFGQLEGAVMAANSSPVPNATVLIYNSSDVHVDTAVTNPAGGWTSNLLPYGDYKARTANAAGFTNELYNDIPCHPTCSLAPGTLVTLNQPVLSEGIYFILSPNAPARMGVSGTGAHSPGYLWGAYSVNLGGPSAPGGTFTYSRNGVNLVSTAVVQFSVVGSTVIVNGIGTVNGLPNYTYTAVFQNGGPKKLSVDIRRPNGTIVQAGMLSSLTAGTFTIAPAP